MELGLGDVFGRIVRRDGGLCRRGGFQKMRLSRRRIFEDHDEECGQRVQQIEIILNRSASLL